MGISSQLKIIDVINSNDKKLISQLKEIRNTLISLHPLSPTKTDKEIALIEEKMKERIAHMLNLESSITKEIKIKEKLSTKLQKINSDLMEKALAIF